ncbi:MAG TPA: hypothetical protein PJ991_07910 [Kiritimatiellia bacterium]|nr:hypothetical protein [Kiritimatiellia bacterium]
MNRILKQRFNQISRQNSFLFATRDQASAVKSQTALPKMAPARPVVAPDRQPVDLRRD